MSAQEKPDRLTEADDTAARVADLGELLGHLNESRDDERRALARQLHDSVGSSLTALSMHLALLTRHFPQEPALLERAGQMKQLLLNIIENNRQMQFKLWNDKLEFLGLNVALDELASRFGAQYAVAVRCSLPETEPTCPRRHGVALLRALEEALSNIAAHAGANQIEVIVDDADAALTLTVSDNGVGLRDGASAQPGKHGLRALRERMRHLGGTLTLAAAQPCGTTLRASLPKEAA